jgi:hypothetical protein
MEKVKILNSVRLEIDDYITLFYDEEYFGFLESSEEYVNKIYDFIYTIPTLRRKQTKNNRYGTYYCSYKANTNTTWYIVFDIDDDDYLIRFITNNHTREYAVYIGG